MEVRGQRLIIAIDPGPVKSALVMWDGTSIQDLQHSENDNILSFIASIRDDSEPWPCVIEMIASYGMSVGQEVFETCVWIGRFMEAYGSASVERMPRMAVKMHLCHKSTANDSNIRTALIDRFGGKSAAIGRKKTPGPLYGVAGDQWAALALAITWTDLKAAR